MALTPVQELRGMVGETSLSDEELSEILVAKGTLNAAAAYIWAQKVTNTVGLVDISESGSSRKMSNVHTQTMAMAEYYRTLAEGEDGLLPSGRRRGNVNYIERP